jgi:hypothetical protein
MIRMPLLETIAALRRALREASVEPEDLAAVLLVGGSSRIPMVAEMVGAELRRPVAVDADPKNVVALGAARTAGAHTETVEPVLADEFAPVVLAGPPPAPTPASAPPEPAAEPPPTSTAPPSEPTVAAPSEASTERPPTVSPPPDGGQPQPPMPPKRPRRRRGLLIGSVVAAVVLLGAAAGAFALLSGGGTEHAGNQQAGKQQGFVSPCPAAGHPAVCITSISFDGNDLVAQFTTHDLNAARSAFQNGLVGTVFFLAAIDESQASSMIASGRTNAWLPWGTQPPFGRTNSAGQRGFTASTIASSATALCALLGDANGGVLTNTGNCAELPAKP